MKTSLLPKAWEKMDEQVSITCLLDSDWLRGLREFYRPIIGLGKANPIESLITFDTRLIISPYTI